MERILEANVVSTAPTSKNDFLEEMFVLHLFSAIQHDRIPLSFKLYQLNCLLGEGRFEITTYKEKGELQAFVIYG